MGNGASSDHDAVSGYQVVRVLPCSPAEKAGLSPFFDFITTLDDIPMTERERSFFVEYVSKSKNQPLKMLVFSTKTMKFRDVILRPTDNWGGSGLLGCTIRFEQVSRARDYVWHVLDVEAASPAEEAALEPENDYIVGEGSNLFNDDSECFSFLEQNTNSQISLFVYNLKQDSFRNVIVDMSGKERIGASIANGFSHYIPCIEDAKPYTPVIHSNEPTKQVPATATTAATAESTATVGADSNPSEVKPLVFDISSNINFTTSATTADNKDDMKDVDVNALGGQHDTAIAHQHAVAEAEAMAPFTLDLTAGAENTNDTNTAGINIILDESIAPPPEDLFPESDDIVINEVVNGSSAIVDSFVDLNLDDNSDLPNDTTESVTTATVDMNILAAFPVAPTILEGFSANQQQPQQPSEPTTPQQQADASEPADVTATATDAVAETSVVQSEQPEEDASAQQPAVTVDTTETQPDAEAEAKAEADSTMESEATTPKEDVEEAAPEAAATQQSESKKSSKKKRGKKR